MASFKRVVTMSLCLVLIQSQAFAVTFNGGLCESQGDWIKTALVQSETIVNAITALKDDPACGGLAKFLEESQHVADIKDAAKNLPEGQTFLSSVFQDFSAIGSYLRPEKMVSTATGGAGNLKNLQNMIRFLLYNKSYNAVDNISTQGNLKASGGTNGAAEVKQEVAPQLTGLVTVSKAISKSTISLATSLFNNLPMTQECFHARPDTAQVVFGAAISGIAALASNGDIDNVNQLVASLMKFARENEYFKIKANIELQKFFGSAGCLVESTSESYCSLVDAENTLDFVETPVSFDNIGSDSEVEKVLTDPLNNMTTFPLAGLTLLMRDAPIMTDWMKRVIWGIDPQLSLEATQKNQNWLNILNNIQKDNEIRGKFTEMYTLYQYNAQNSDTASKLSQIKTILNSVMDSMGVGMPGSRGGFGNGDGEQNFYANVKNSDLMAWYLIGLQNAPEEYTGAVTFDAIWSQWVRTGKNGFNNPDALIETLRSRTFEVMDTANVKAAFYVNQRLIVDPLNLVVEATNGQGVTPYVAFENMRIYCDSLINKFEYSKKILSANASFAKSRTLQNHVKSLDSAIPLLRDTSSRLTRVLKAIDTIRDLKPQMLAVVNGQVVEATEQRYTEAVKSVMDIIYDSGKMLLSRDSFFSTRLKTILQADISDAIYHTRFIQDVDNRQVQHLMSLGNDLISRIAKLFSVDPVVQHLDLAQAKEIQKANLESVENLLARVIFQQILDIDCNLYGGEFCQLKNMNLDPVVLKDKTANMWTEFLSTFSGEPTIVAKLEAAASLIDGSKVYGRARSQLPHAKVMQNAFKPTDDDEGAFVTRAKLCTQALAFESRNIFKHVCKGATLVSPYAGAGKDKDLNLSFDEKYESLQSMLNSSEQGRITKTRTEAVCAFRNYIKVNRVYQMFRDYVQAAQ